MVCGLTFTAATTSADDEFIVEMARHASVIEDWALPDPDSEDTQSLLPIGDGPTILAKNQAGVLMGAAWIIEHDPALIVDGHGAASPELVIAVAPERRGQGIGSALLDELISQCSATYDALSLNVHQRNPASRLYERKGFHVHGPGRGALGIAMLKEFR